MHPLLANQNSLYNVRVLALSLAAAQLFVEDCTGSDRLSFSMIVEKLLFPFSWIKQTVASWFGCQPAQSVSSNSPTKATTPAQQQQTPGPTQAPPPPTFNTSSGSVPTLQSSFALLPPSSGDKIEMSFLKDICRYIYQYQYDLVLLQEIKSEETFVVLCDIFRNTQLAYSHFYQCNNLTSCNSLFNLNWSGQASNNGMAVFSRWPLVSVKVEPIDSMLTKAQLWYWPWWLWPGSWSFRRRPTNCRTCPVNSSNAIQYVQINIDPSQPITSLAKMNLPNRKYPTLTVHLFNVQLLNQSFIVLPAVPHSGGGATTSSTNNWHRPNRSSSPNVKHSPTPQQNRQKSTKSIGTIPQLIASHLTNRRMSEQQLLRLCQIFELCKLVNSVEQICANNQNNVSYGFGPTGGGGGGVSGVNNNNVNNHHQDIILIGGNFGHLDSGHHSSIGSFLNGNHLSGGASNTSIVSSGSSVNLHQNHTSGSGNHQCLTVQDILQTFIPGLHNVYQNPEMLLNGDEVTQKLLRSKLFLLPKNEQLFIKYILYDPGSKGATTIISNTTAAPSGGGSGGTGSKTSIPPRSPSVSDTSSTAIHLLEQQQQQMFQCQIEFIHSKIKFNSYIQSMVNDYGWTIADWKHHIHSNSKNKFNHRPHLMNHPESKSRNIIDRYNNIIKSPVIEQPKGFNISIQLSRQTVQRGPNPTPGVLSSNSHHVFGHNQFRFSSNDEEESIKNHLTKSLNPNQSKQPQPPQRKQAGQIELHLQWCTLRSKIRVIQLFKVAIRKYGQRLRTSQFRHSMLIYLLSLLILVCMSILMRGSIIGFLAMVVILLNNLYLLFRIKNQQISKMVNKLQELIDQLNFELLVINTTVQHQQQNNQDAGILQPVLEYPNLWNEGGGAGITSQNNEWWIKYFVEKQKRINGFYKTNDTDSGAAAAAPSGTSGAPAAAAAAGGNGSTAGQAEGQENNTDPNNNNDNNNNNGEEPKKALDRFLGFKSQDTFGSGNFDFSQSRMSFRNSEISPISTTSF